ncbi:MAG: group 1 truncated hemoglobin [Casimicrobium sp.]
MQRASPFLTFRSLLASALWVGATSVTFAQAPNEAALAAFGGFAGLSKMTQDFVERVQKNPRIGRFFKEADTERLQAMLTDQFCDVLGGGCHYQGKSMKEAHTNMRVANADFNALAEELQNALNAANVPFAEQNKLIAKLAPMQRDIVEK